MASVNKVILVGNLGADPEKRSTGSGNAVCNLRVATTEVWKDKSGARQEKTEWHRVVVFGVQAENCAKYLAKGRQVYIEGNIQTRKWEDQQGQTRYTTEVVAQRVQFLGGKEGGRSGETRVEDSTADAFPPPSNDFDQGANDDDIPF